MERWWRSTVSGEARGAACALARAALSALSLPYSLVMRGNLALYQSGLRSRTQPALPVASVGNITLGGTGKTTATRRIARELLARGIRPGVVLRGHMRSGQQPQELISRGDGLLVEAAQAGDEAAMLAATCPGASIAVGKRRERVIELLEDAGAQVALLDDGFQYFRMKRLIDLVLVDATFDLAAARVFPRGYLREPLDHLRRATHLLVTHSNLVADSHLRRLQSLLHDAAPDLPLMLSRHAATGFYWLDKPQELIAPGEFRGRDLLAMSAVGNPASFEGLLLQLGANVTARCAFPDHHAYAPSDWDEVEAILRLRDAEAIVVTEKDAVKLPPAPEGLPPIAAVAVELEITAHKESWDDLVGSIERAARQEPAPSEF